ncbi:MAG: asparaginase domain-containing protein [Gammaproteobacteria bacterium]|jgi:L-asparaginase|nr:asparaginase domain-containing protein [Gammaproteobacteria bacterium]
MQAIRILTVGGTIDKVYFDALSEYEVGVPYALEILEELNLNLDCRVTSLMRKDSLEMVDEDRALVRQAVADAEENLIVITHGTDTMVDTAKALEPLFDQADFTKTIVLTGALAPAIFKKSDAMFNIGAALTAVQTVAPGVYIAMSGEVFAANAVVKDREGQRFVATP